MKVVKFISHDELVVEYIGELFFTHELKNYDCSIEFYFESKYKMRHTNENDFPKT